MYKVKTIYKPFLFIIDVVGYLFFWWIKLKKLREPKKILCISVGHIGDVLLTTPSYRGLKQRFPKAKIDVLIRSFSKQILEGNKNINKAICFDLPWLGLYGRKTGFFQVFKFIKELRKERYDLILDFHADPRNILLAFLVGKYRISYGIRGFGFLLNKVVKFKKLQHQIKYNLDLIHPTGASASDKMDFVIPKSAENRAKNLLKQFAGGKIIGITPSTGRKPKYWINERWADTADELIERYNAVIVLTGGKGDKKDNQEILAHMEHADKVTDLSGKTSLKELGAVIKQCKLFVCPDTGPAHIAKAVNTPLIELFGPENPHRWGYKDKKSSYLWKKSMKDISVSDVLNEINKLGVLK